MKRVGSVLAALLWLLPGAAAFAKPPPLPPSAGNVTIVGVPEVGQTLTAKGVPLGASCVWKQGGSTISSSCNPVTLTGTGALTLQVTTAGKTTYAAITISGSCPTTGTQGTAYTCSGIAAGGSGATPYVYSLRGPWPAGITINSATGVVGNAPTVGGTFNGLSVGATDAAGGSAQIANFNLTIASNSLSITGTPPSTGTVGTAYSFTPTVSGGSSPYNCNFTGSLPPGLSPSGGSPNTGCNLTGTPTTPGTYSGLAESVTDSASTTAQLAANPFTITIASAGGSPSLDFSQASNSQYAAVVF